MAVVDAWCAPSWPRALPQPPSVRLATAYRDLQTNYPVAADPSLREPFGLSWQCRRRCRCPGRGKRPSPPPTGPRDPVCPRHRVAGPALSPYLKGPTSWALPAQTRWAGAQTAGRPSVARVQSCRKCLASALHRTCDETEKPRLPGRSHRG